MRLPPETIVIIKKVVSRLDPDAKVYLFGSRTDPRKRGGDIDLLIFSHALKEIDSLEILKQIYEEMEEQKIDLLITSNAQDPFVQLALRDSIEL